MTWKWKFFDAAGAEIDTTGRFDEDPVFASQADAETWVGEYWQDLLDDDIEAVTLMDGDKEIYGQMSLRPNS